MKSEILSVTCSNWLLNLAISICRLIVFDAIVESPIPGCLKLITLFQSAEFLAEHFMKIFFACKLRLLSFLKIFPTRISSAMHNTFVELECSGKSIC